MNAPAPEPKPKRSRRMIVWLVVVPAVLLLLALAGANWKTFHLAYAKQLMGSDDPDKQYRGVVMVFETHVREGMTLEEVRRLLTPAKLTETDIMFVEDDRWIRRFMVAVEGYPSNWLWFDEKDRLIIDFSLRSQGPRPPGPIELK